MLAGGLLLAACQGPAAGPAAVEDLGGQAAAALGRGEYARAAELYRRALPAEPDRLALHYGLAVATSHLDLREEAVREFRWVVERGPAGSPEVEAARRWLASAGALGGDAREGDAEAGGREPGNTIVEGRAMVAEPGEEPRPAARRQIILVGQGGAAQEARYRLRTDEEGRFRFPNVVPGTYMLTDAVAGPATWRLRVEVPPSQEFRLDLTPANSTRVRDDFPNRG